MKCKHLRPEGATTYSWVGPTKMQNLCKEPKIETIPCTCSVFFSWTSIFSKEALRKSTHSHFDPLLNMSYAIKKRASGDVDDITEALQYIVAGEK